MNILIVGGTVQFAPFSEMTPELYELGLKNKLMGQVNLVRLGLPYLKDRGSFTFSRSQRDE